jgi:hypothetical protein
MYIESVPNRGSPPAILLRESYRDGKSIRKRTLLNLSDWPAEHVEGLRGVLKGGVVIPAGQEALRVERSLPHGHVAAVLGTARSIGLDRLLGPKTRDEPNRPRDLVLAMIVSRIIAPASKLATAKALDPATAASSLGVELALGDVDEAELYAALDWLLERQGAIEAERWCSTMSRRAMSKAAAVRWPSAATTGTARRASSRSSTACCAPPTAVPSRSRSSRATRATRTPWPIRSPS